MKERFIKAGEIVNTHGTRGEVSILVWTDSPEFLRTFKTLYVDGAALAVETARVHKRMLLVKFEGVEDINAAIRLKGRTICLDREDAALPKGQFFLQDLLGARVVTESGQEVGTLEDILESPASNIYVVRGAAEHLIPAVPEFIVSTDAENGLVTVRLIEGM